MLREYRLRVHAIRFRAKVGASRTERAMPQELLVDVELELPVSAFPKRDQRREVVDYDGVVRLVVEVGQLEPYRLLETYSERVLERLLAETPASRARVSVTKLRVPSTHSVDRAVVELVGSRE